jgi:hypothetical protein
MAAAVGLAMWVDGAAWWKVVASAGGAWFVLMLATWLDDVWRRERREERLKVLAKCPTCGGTGWVRRDE